MMWADTTLVYYVFTKLALPSDLTDAEWRRQEPCLPQLSHIGRSCKWLMRGIIEAIYAEIIKQVVPGHVLARLVIPSTIS
jgi:hypothetical protein